MTLSMVEKRSRSNMHSRMKDNCTVLVVTVTNLTSVDLMLSCSRVHLTWQGGFLTDWHDNEVLRCEVQILSLGRLNAV